MKLVITLHGSSDLPPLIFDIARVEKLVFGRSARDSSWIPNVDLTKYGAHRLGVSRRHATINRTESGLHILDLGSANGTFLNEIKLPPHQAHLIRNGDAVRIGYFKLGIRLEQ